MRTLQTLKRVGENSDAIVQGIANHSDLVNRKVEALITGMDNQSKLLDDRFGAMIQALNKLNATMQLVYNELRRAPLNRPGSSSTPSKF